MVGETAFITADFRTCNRTTTAWMGALSVGTVVAAYFFKRYPVATPDHEVVMAGQIRAEREDQKKGPVV